MQAWRRSLSLGPWMCDMWHGTPLQARAAPCGMALLCKLESHLPCGNWSVLAKAPYWAWINPIKI